MKELLGRFLRFLNHVNKSEVHVPEKPLTSRFLELDALEPRVLFSGSPIDTPEESVNTAQVPTDSGDDVEAQPGKVEGSALLKTQQALATASPTITSDGGGEIADVTIQENSLAVTTVKAKNGTAIDEEDSRNVSEAKDEQDSRDVSEAKDEEDSRDVSSSDSSDASEAKDEEDSRDVSDSDSRDVSDSDSSDASDSDSRDVSDSDSRDVSDSDSSDASEAKDEEDSRDVSDSDSSDASDSDSSDASEAKDEEDSRDASEAKDEDESRDVSEAKDDEASTNQSGDKDEEASELAFSIDAGTADGKLFAIDNDTGELSFVSAPDFERPQDSNLDNIYEVKVVVANAKDPSLSDSQLIRVTVADVNEAPLIISNGGGDTASIELAENTLLVATVTAKDEDTVKKEETAQKLEPARKVEADQKMETAQKVEIARKVEADQKMETAQKVETARKVEADQKMETAQKVETAQRKDAAKKPPQKSAYQKDAAKKNAAGAAKKLKEAPAQMEADAAKQMQKARAPKEADAAKQMQKAEVPKDADADQKMQRAPAPQEAEPAKQKEKAEAQHEAEATKATEAAKSSLVFAIDGGADQDLFKIDSHSGLLSFKEAPDFEMPQSSDLNNTYQVRVVVANSDDLSLTDSQLITVTVTDVIEGNRNVSIDDQGVVTITDQNGEVLSIQGTGEDGEGIVIDGSDEVDDHFVIDLSSGGLAGKEITVHGGGQVTAEGDALTVVGADGQAHTYDFGASNEDGFAGTITVDGTAIHFTGLEPIVNEGTVADVVFNLPTDVQNADAVLSVYSDTQFELSGSTFENVVFDTPTGSVTINGNVGDIISTPDAVLSFKLIIKLNPVKNSAPVITSDGGGDTASIKVAENTTAVTTVTVAPNSNIKFNPLGGADAKLFSFDYGTGALSFLGAPDFEKPADADGKNNYEVLVSFKAYSDSGSTSDSQLITVNVTDVAEGSIFSMRFGDSVSEGGFAKPLIKRTGTITQGASVYLETLDGSATLEDGDYTKVSRIVNFAAGQVKASVPIYTTEDTKFEQDETLTVRLLHPSKGSSIDVGTATVTILNDDKAGSTFSVEGTKVTEGDKGTVRITRTGNLDAEASVFIRVADGSATLEDNDYSIPSVQAVKFLKGQKTAEVSFNTTEDTRVEQDETFTVGLLNPSKGSSIGVGTATVTILNDDKAGSTFSVKGTKVTEGDNSLVRITRTGNVDAEASVRIRAIDGSATLEDHDYSLLTQTVNFLKGQKSAVVSFKATEDTRVEKDETFTVNLLKPSKGSSIDVGTATVTILNDDSATVTIADASVTEGGDLVFALTLDNAVDVDTTVTYSTADGTATTADSDYTPATTATTTILAGATTGSITIATTGDTTVELDEDLLVTLDGLSAGGREASLSTAGTTTSGGLDAATGTILSDELPTTSATLDVGGNLVIDDIDGADTVDNFFIRLDGGGNLIVEDLDGNTVGSNVAGSVQVGASRVDIPVISLTGGLTINTNVSDDTITLGDLGTLAGNLTVNGGTGQDTINQTGDATLAGMGVATYTAEEIFMQAGSSLTTDTGNVTFSATGLTGNGPGVRLKGADITSTSGNVDIDGQGGTTGNYNRGILLDIDLGTATASTISTGGQIDLTGTGGPGGLFGTGIEIIGGTVESTGAGPVTIIGSGGAGSAFNVGVAMFKGTAVDAGTGNLSITGTGGSTGTFNRGINIATTTLDSAGGNIAVNGFGGGAATGMFGVGTELVDVDIETTGTGTITLAGTGHTGTMGNLGLKLAGGSTVTTVDGAISMDGTGRGTSLLNHGVQIAAASQLAATGAGTITIQGTGSATGSLMNFGVEIASFSTVTVNNGDLTVLGTGGGTTLMGRGVVLANTTLESTGLGNIAVTGNGSTGTSTGMSPGIEATAATIKTTGTGNITLTGSGGTGTMLNNGIRLATRSAVSTVSGTITIDGTGGGTGTSSSGVQVDAVSSVSAGGAGTLTLRGTGANGTSSNEGVRVASASSLTTFNGNMTVEGTAHGTGLFLTGVRLSGANLSSSGTGDISILGTSTTQVSTGVFNMGINMAGGSVTTVTGAIDMTGFGGQGATLNQGIRIVAATLRSTGAGAINLKGTAHAETTGLLNSGVYLLAVNLDTTGAIDVRGTGGGLTSMVGTIGLNHGVYMGAITANGSTPSVTGIAGFGTLSKLTDGNFFL